MDKIQTLKGSNAELGAKITRSASSVEPEASNHQCLNDRLEGLLLQHLSLKKQLFRVSQQAWSPEKDSSNGCEETVRRKQHYIDTVDMPTVTEQSKLPDNLEQFNLSEKSDLSVMDSGKHGNKVDDKRTSVNSKHVCESDSEQLSDNSGMQGGHGTVSRKAGKGSCEVLGQPGNEVEKLRRCSKTGLERLSRVLVECGGSGVTSQSIEQHHGDVHEEPMLLDDDGFVESQNLPESDRGCEAVSVEDELKLTLGNGSGTEMLEQTATDAVVLEEHPSGAGVLEQPASDAGVSKQPLSSAGVLEQPAFCNAVYKNPPSCTNVLEQSPDDANIFKQPSRSTRISGQPPSPARLELLQRDSAVHLVGPSDSGGTVEAPGTTPSVRTVRSKQSSNGVMQFEDSSEFDSGLQTCNLGQVPGLQQHCAHLARSETTSSTSSTTETHVITGRHSGSLHPLSNTMSNSAVHVASESPPSTCQPSCLPCPPLLLPTEAVQPCPPLPSCSLPALPSTTSPRCPSSQLPVSSRSSSSFQFCPSSSGPVCQSETSVQPWPVSSLLSGSNIPIPVVSSSDDRSLTSSSEYASSTSGSSVFSNPSRVNKLASISSSDLSSISSSCPSSLILSSCSAGPNAASSSSSVCTTTSGTHSNVMHHQVSELSVVASSAIEASKRNSRETESVVGSRLAQDPGPRKVPRTGEVPMSLHQGTMLEMGTSRPRRWSASSEGSRHNFHTTSQSGLCNRRAERDSSLDATTAAPVSSPCVVGFRHCGTGTFTNSTQVHSSLPQANPQQPTSLYSHQHSQCHPPSSVIVQPWLDQANNNQTASPDFAQPQIHISNISRPTSRSTGRATRGPGENGRMVCGCNRPWSDGQQQSFPFTSQAVPHPFPPPPQPHPPQHLDPQQHPYTPYYQPHEYNSWSLYSNKMKQSYHGGGATVQPAVGSGWRTRSSRSYLHGLNMAQSDGGGGRQWDACNHQRHSASFMQHDHVMPCDSMTSSPFPGVWRPYSEANPSRGFCVSESAAPSLPSHHLPYMDLATSPSSRHPMQMGHISTAHSSFTEATPTQASHSVQMGAPSHTAHLRQTTSHQDSHFLQMEPTQPSSHPNTHSSGLPNQHTLQMEPTQPTSRTESFFVDRLLYDIG